MGRGRHRAGRRTTSPLWRRLLRSGPSRPVGRHRRGGPAPAPDRLATRLTALTAEVAALRAELSLLAARLEAAEGREPAAPMAPPPGPLASYEASESVPLAPARSLVSAPPPTVLPQRRSAPGPRLPLQQTGAPERVDGAVA